MRNASRVTILCLLTFGALIFSPTARAQTRAPIADEIAKAYGVDSWGQVDAIRYTWNVTFPGVNVSHSWVWEPKTGKVSFETKDKDGKTVKVSYNHSQLSGEPANVKDEVDPAFMNDQYWLIFPFHVAWDTGAAVDDKGKQKLPLGKGTATQVVVKYPAQSAGYTPGDTWELFVGPDNVVKEFIYRRGGPKKPSVVIATWTGYKKAGPILISTDHRGTADGKPLHLWITDIAVKLAGSDTWVNAK